jgi:hypothetical protein
MKKSHRLPKGFQVQVNEIGMGKFAVTINHIGQDVALFWRNFASPAHAWETGAASATALADCVRRGIKL